MDEGNGLLAAVLVGGAPVEALVDWLAEAVESNGWARVAAGAGCEVRVRRTTGGYYDGRAGYQGRCREQWLLPRADVVG